MTLDSPLMIGTPLVKPVSNSTTTFQVQPSGSTTPVINVDTTNSLVGVGTATPSGKLHVKGTADDQQVIVQGFSTQTTNPFEVWKSDNTVVFSVSNTGLITTAGGMNSSGNIVLNNAQSFAVKDTGGTTRNCLTVNASDIMDIGAKATVSAIDFYAGSTTKLGEWTTTGLGIGNITPATILDMAQNTNPATIRLRRVDLSIAANDPIGKIEFYAADTSTISNFIVADIEAQAVSSISTDINPGRLIFRTTPSDVAATPTERMRITNTGSVLVGTTAVSSSNNLFEAYSDTTDASKTVSVASALGTTTTSATNYTIGFAGFAYKHVAAGQTDSGYVQGNRFQVFRNTDAGYADNGTLVTMTGVNVSYGHYVTNAAATPITTTAKGVNITPYYNTGTITTAYDLFLDSGSAGATITNRWSIYQESTASRNYLASPTTIQGPLNYGIDAQASDTYIISLNTAITAYTDGLQVIFKANTANTGAATLNVNGLGAKTIVKAVSTTLANNDILAGMYCLVIYNGTNFVLMNPRAL